MSAPEATVFIVDDDPSVLRAVARLVRSADWKVAAFSSAREFLEKYVLTAPGCLVLDVTMSGMDGLDLQKALAQIGSELPIIFLTGDGDIPMSVQAIKNGAHDFLSKPCADEVLLAAIAHSLEQDRQTRSSRAEERLLRDRFSKLTPREREVMLGVVAGQLNKQIAAELGTGEKTIKVHRARMMEKLRVRTVADLVRLTEQMRRANLPL